MLVYVLRAHFKCIWLCVNVGSNFQITLHEFDNENTCYSIYVRLAVQMVPGFFYCIFAQIFEYTKITGRNDCTEIFIYYNILHISKTIKGA